MNCRNLGFKNILRIIFTTLVGVSILVGLTAAYIIGYNFIKEDHYFFSFGVYGAILALHVIIQSLFAFLEHKRTDKTLGMNVDLTKNAVLCIAAYQEDPDYLRKCLESVKRLSYPNMKIILVIDGNSEDDAYMMDTFKELMGCDQTATFVWRSNFHERDTGVTEELHQESIQRVKDIVVQNQFVCIMQKWGGKREVMYTAFKAIGEHADYIQVCDSDTMLDPAATVELVKVLENNPTCGGVGGDVQILNKYDSWVSFLSSVRYWMAFNIERACQSYFGCVQCISGPLGMYRNDLLQQFLEAWYNQEFMGSKCSFGDDRHLTNRVLSLGFSTKYTSKSKCLTETPTKYLRWLNQQTRWSKSYFREWLYNSLWFYKHNVWMTYEAVVTGFFPFFLVATVIQLFYRGRIWNILLFLMTVQFIGLVKAVFGSFLRRDITMLFMSVYSILYMSSLLPAKMYALLTINSAGWGTSGRKTIVVNFIGLIPVTVWCTILLGGIIYTIYAEIKTGIEFLEVILIFIAVGVYVCYWVVMYILYSVYVLKCTKYKSRKEIRCCIM
ncbi:hyaluronan synthase 2-like [Protopterus annectens]|uniref:hyaluronan synthase 2-like n=1 Tax=Protopterus annectens TaxID=7888 RepID=UPI001CF97D7F|nr:hyaluronan synthase 2-like [Protopterus annectens]